MHKAPLLSVPNSKENEYALEPQTSTVWVKVMSPGPLKAVPAMLEFGANKMISSCSVRRCIEDSQGLTPRIRAQTTVPFVFSVPVGDARVRKGSNPRDDLSRTSIFEPSVSDSFKADRLRADTWGRPERK